MREGVCVCELVCLCAFHTSIVDPDDVTASGGFLPHLIDNSIIGAFWTIQSVLGEYTHISGRLAYLLYGMKMGLIAPWQKYR